MRFPYLYLHVDTTCVHGKRTLVAEQAVLGPRRLARKACELLYYGFWFGEPMRITAHSQFSRFEYHQIEHDERFNQWSDEISCRSTVYLLEPMSPARIPSVTNNRHSFDSCPFCLESRSTVVCNTSPSSTFISFQYSLL